MSIVININHDTGPPTSDHWSFVSDGTVTVTAAAAGLNGTAYGIEVDTANLDITGDEVQQPFTAITSGGFRVRFRIDLSNATTTATVSTFSLITVRVPDTTNFLYGARVRTQNAAANEFDIQFAYRPDTGSFPLTLHTTANFVGSVGEKCIEFAGVRATNSVSSDGAMYCYVDGALVASKTDIDNFDRWTSLGVDELAAFFVKSSSEITGSLYIDEFILDDDETVSYCSPPDQFTIAPMRKPADIDADGSNIYLALLNSGGTPVLLQLDTGLATDATKVFDPGAGDDIGVQCGRFNASIVYVAGAFDGTNVVERSADAGSTFTVIDDGTFGDVETFIIGPDSDDRVWIFDSDNGDIQETIDAGTNWTAVNSSVTPVIRAVDRLGINVQEAVFGNALAASDNADYSVNSGGNLEDLVFPVEVDITGIIVN